MYRFFPTYAKQIMDLLRSYSVDCDGFVKNYSDTSTDICFATSFSPEYIEENKSFRSRREREQFVKQTLLYVVREMKIRDVRLGFRWDRLVNKNGHFDFSYYRVLFETCLEMKIDMVLNVGPVKVFRWPEQHIPENILASSPQPRKGAVIRADSLVAKHAFGHLERLMKFLEKEYSQNDLKHVTNFQIENEAFHSFGTKEWKFSDDYVLKAASIVLRHFPNAGILFNSSENTNLSRIIDLYDLLRAKKKLSAEQFLVGINYYYKVPGKVRQFLIGPDSVSYCETDPENSYRRLLSQAYDKGYKIEISEAQWEKWLPIQSPGRSFAEFVYMLMRCSRILTYGQGKTVRLWGVEDFVFLALQKRLSNAQKDMLSLIQRVQERA